MSVIIDAQTRVLVQGITGQEGRFWTGHMLGLGTNVVGGVTPGKEGQEVEGVPVFDTVRRATEEFEVELVSSERALSELLNGTVKTMPAVAAILVATLSRARRRTKAP